VWTAAAAVIAAYLLGSVSFARWLARRKGLDIQAFGSGNPGATNVGRALGPRAGRTVLALDALKGALPTLGGVVSFGATDARTAAIGVAAVAGHLWPVWHGLRGGRGAATGLGVLFAVAPGAGAIAGLAYLLARWGSGRASVGSLTGAGLGTGAIAGWEWQGPEPMTPRTWMALLLLALVVGAHRPNIARLVRGEEPRT
jgi:glycerol-3-phosphate acyltransferase PlsY